MFVLYEYFQRNTYLTPTVKDVISFIRNNILHRGTCVNVNTIESQYARVTCWQTAKTQRVDGRPTFLDG